MSVSCLTSAKLCQEIYDQKSESWDAYWSAGEVTCAYRKIGEDDTLTFMGSNLVIDFIRDAEGWPAWDPEIGFCHAGFLRNMDAVLVEVRGTITQPVTIQGHSLGGARARIAAAKMLYRGLQVKRLCTFGSPKPGFANIRRIIEKSGIEHVSYRNLNDPITLVPGILPLWEHTESWQIFNEPSSGEDLDPLRDHCIRNYIAGASKL